MAREIVTVRMESEVRAALDQIATHLQRDRNFVVNEAVSSYLDVHKWQLAHIRQGLREAIRGEYVSESAVHRAFREVGVRPRRSRRK